MKACQEKTTEFKNTDEQLTSVVKRLGNPISTILLDLPCRIFSIPHLDGVVGYQLFKNCAVVIGDPICLPQNIAELTQAFHLYCQKYNWKIVYFLASDSFAHWAINNGCPTLIQVGEELILDPTCFQQKQKIRWKINQSLHHGVVIKEYQNFDPLLEKQMKNTIDACLKAKHGPQIYLGRLNFFSNYGGKRIFYALQEDKIIGLLALSQIDQCHGWVVNYFLALDAPVGITEHLMSSVFGVLADENCHFLCLGVVSGSKLGEIVGLNVFSKFVVRFIFKISRWLFHLDKRKIYLNKYHPSLSPTYILTSGKLSISELLAIKKTLNIKF
jgi:lysylphosphatidylglycerol synthetase-like protein (DUF2156 family)